jgi:hypothetical protein
MREGPAVRIVWRFTQLLLAAPLLYLAAVLVVFDFGTLVNRVDVESVNGREAYLGPRPRFVQGEMSSFLWTRDYSGREWPFRIFRPVCRAWVRIRGYAWVEGLP